jgi:hypothetical protein
VGSFKSGAHFLRDDKKLSFYQRYVQGKIKKAMNPKPTGVGNEQMHYVGLNLVLKNDGSGYWIPLKGEFDPLISEAEQKLRSIISQIIKEELKK